MKNKKKVCGLIFVGALAMATAGAGLLVNPTVEANAADAGVTSSDTRFEMTGASVRFDDPTGLRFEALVGVDLATKADVEFGMIIFPKNIMEMYSISTEYSATMNYHTEITTKAAEYVSQYPLIDMSIEPQVVYAETDTEKTNPIHYTLWGSIAEIKYENLARDWWSVAYAKEGDTYTYAEFANAVNVRNVVYVASAAVSDSNYSYTDAQKDTMKGFVSKAFYKANGKTEEAANELVANKEWATFTATLSETKVTMEAGECKKLSVLANGLTLGASWSTNNANVATVDKYGVVKAVGFGEATITAICMGETVTCNVTVASPANFTYVPESVFVPVATNINVEKATVSEGANLSWVIEYYNYRSINDYNTLKNNTLAKSANNADALALDGSHQMARVTWILSYGDYTEKAYTYYLPETGNNNVQVETLNDTYNTYWNGAVSGNVTVSSDVTLFGETNWLRLSGDGATASGSFVGDKSVYLGDARTYFDMMFYNPTNSACEVVVNGANVVVPAHMIVMYEAMYWGYDSAVVGWGTVTSDGYLNNVSLSVKEANAPVDIYVGLVRINKGAFDLGVLSLEGGVDKDTATATVTFDKVSNAKTYSYAVSLNGNQVVTDGVPTVNEGVYTIVYDYSDWAQDILNLEIQVTASDGVNTITKSYTKTFLEFTSMPKSKFIAPKTEINMVLPTYDAGTLTYETLYYDARAVAASAAGNVKGHDQVNKDLDARQVVYLSQVFYAAVTTWTLTIGEQSIVAYTYYLPNVGIIDWQNTCEVMSLSEQYSNYYANGFILNEDISICNEELIEGETNWMKIGNNSSNYRGYAYSGTVDVGNCDFFSYWILNASDYDVNLTLGGGMGADNVSIGAHRMVCYDLYWGYSGAVTGRGYVQNGKYNYVYVSDNDRGTVVPQGEMEIYLGAVRVNADAFVGV